MAERLPYFQMGFGESYTSPQDLEPVLPPPTHQLKENARIIVPRKDNKPGYVLVSAIDPIQTHIENGQVVDHEQAHRTLEEMRVWYGVYHRTWSISSNTLIGVLPKQARQIRTSRKK